MQRKIPILLAAAALVAVIVTSLALANSNSKSAPKTFMGHGAQYWYYNHLLAEMKKDSAKQVPIALKKAVIWQRQRTWVWQDAMLMPHTPTNYAERQVNSKAYVRWVLQVWKQRHHRVLKRATNPPHYHQWMCIHSYEGSWTDPDAPYYGGLQMDLSFQRTYGGHLLDTKGTADHWTMFEQMWVAERAYSSGRGFYPWPNTARWCGLL